MHTSMVRGQANHAEFQFIHKWVYLTRYDDSHVYIDTDYMYTLRKIYGNLIKGDDHLQE